MSRMRNNPVKIANYLFAVINNKLKLTESVKVSNGGERMVITDFETAKKSNDFNLLAHTQRYEWLSPQVRNMKCLDDGCGSGYGTHYLAQNGAESIIGIDLSNAAIKFANKHHKTSNCRFKQMNSLDLQFKDNSFEAVLSFDVLEHIPQESQHIFISEIARVLNKEGTAYIGCPNSALSCENNPFHEKELTVKEFKQLLEASFKEVTILGQDLIINGVRQKSEFRKHIADLKNVKGIISKEDSESSYGLLAICKKPYVAIEFQTNLENPDQVVCCEHA